MGSIVKIRTNNYDMCEEVAKLAYHIWTVELLNERPSYIVVEVKQRKKKEQEIIYEVN